MMASLNLAIIGVGLIGGSFGLALKDKLKNDIYITGLSRTEKSMKEAMELGAVDYASADLEKVVKDADIIYLSTPVLQIVPVLKRILPFIKSGAIITDAGSTKKYVSEAIKEILPNGVYYVSGHPMTGKENSGVKAADKNLFKNKCYVIIEDDSVPQTAKDKIISLIKVTGANLTTLDLARHDRCASIISHVPHVVASALVTLLNRSEGDMEACLKLAGGGFKDTTRIASSNADMWADICMTNSEAIAAHLKDCQNIIGEVVNRIEAKDRQALYDYFFEAKKRRDKILDETDKMFEI